MDKEKQIVPVVKIEKTYKAPKSDDQRFQLAAARTGNEIKFTLSKISPWRFGEDTNEKTKDLYVLHLNFVGRHLNDSEPGRLVYIELKNAEGEGRPRSIQLAGQDFLHLHEIFEKGDFNKLFHDAFHCINTDLNERAQKAIGDLPEIGTEAAVESVLALPELRKDQNPLA